VKTWTCSSRWSGAVVRAEGHCEKLLHGSGKLSLRINGRQFRFMTVDQLSRAGSERPTDDEDEFRLEFDSPQGHRGWCFPTFHKEDAKHEEMRLWTEALLRQEEPAVEAALRKLKVIDSNGVWSTSALISLTHKFTVVLDFGLGDVGPVPRFVDLGREMMIHGISSGCLYVSIAVGHMQVSKLPVRKPKAVAKRIRKRPATNSLATPQRQARAALSDPPPLDLSSAAHSLEEEAGAATVLPTKEQGCGDLRAHRRSEPRLPCASPGAAPPKSSGEVDDTFQMSSPELEIDKQYLGCDQCDKWHVVTEEFFTEWQAKWFTCADVGEDCDGSRTPDRGTGVWESACASPQ